MSRKVDISTLIDFDSGSAKKLLDSLKDKLGKTTVDKMSGALADQVVQEYQQSLAENRSVVTGTGLDSIRSEHLGEGVYGIMMVSYLDQVDAGRSAGNKPPVRNNTRLQEAAKQYGVNPYALAQSIANNGTRAHPFKKKALERVESRSSDIAEGELQKVMDEIESTKT